MNNTILNTPNPKHLNYIDALRGLTMLLVVYGHFIYFSLQSTAESSIFVIFQIIRMPLFFCISGFFAYGCYDKILFKKRLKNRLCSQLWPTVCVCFLFVLTFNMGGVEYVPSFKTPCMKTINQVTGSLIA